MSFDLNDSSALASVAASARLLRPETPPAEFAPAYRHWKDFMAAVRPGVPTRPAESVIRSHELLWQAREEALREGRALTEPYLVVEQVFAAQLEKLRHLHERTSAGLRSVIAPKPMLERCPPPTIARTRPRRRDPKS